MREEESCAKATSHLDIFSAHKTSLKMGMKFKDKKKEKKRQQMAVSPHVTKSDKLHPEVVKKRPKLKIGLSGRTKQAISHTDTQKRVKSHCVVAEAFRSV